MAKTKKFDTLFESYMSRFSRGGFLMGDVFKFKDDFKSSEEYKGLGSNVQEMIDQMIETGYHIRVVGIKNDAPARYPADSQSSSLHVVLDIALDTGGGRYTHYCSIPGSLGDPVIYAPNLPPIPDAMRRHDRVDIKPEEAEEDSENIQNKTDRGDGQLSDTERTLPKDNTQLTNQEPYTANYLQGLHIYS